MNKEKTVIKQAKEVCELLGINNERLKYFAQFMKNVATRSLNFA